MKGNGFVAEFRKFIAKGNVLDMAVGVIIGSAFNAIINSLVNDILSPVIGLITGGLDFTNMSLTLVQATEGRDAVILSFGSFLNACVQFLLVALTLFIIVRTANRMKDLRLKKEAEEKAQAPAPKAADIVLLEEIRDLLKNKE